MLVESKSLNDELPPHCPRLRPAGLGRASVRLDSRPSADANIVVVTGHPSVDSAINCLRAKTRDYLTAVPGGSTSRNRLPLPERALRMTEEALKEALGAAIAPAQGLNLTLANRDWTGVSLGYLSQIELGKNSASIERCIASACGLGMKMSELFPRSTELSELRIRTARLLAGPLVHDEQGVGAGHPLTPRWMARSLAAARS